MLSPVDEPRSLEADEPRALWERAAGWLVVGGATLVVLTILNPGANLWPLGDIHFGKLFSDTTTNGGDMGAHIWWPRFLEENWFGKLRLSGWAPDWYAGFPAGQYYFPLPAVLIAAIDTLTPIPYEVAFKLVTVSGPLLLPAAAYSFARGIRAPWPAPPMFAVAALATLVQTRTGWQIYGGNISSTLAGEFSFTLALALGLFGLGALGRSLDTGKRAWLPAVLVAAAAMSHIVVAFFVGLMALLLWLVRKPWRTWRIAVPVGATAIALTAVWSVPLLLRSDYTQSMRYTKLRPQGDWRLWTWLDVPNWVPLHERIRDSIVDPVRNTVEGFASAFMTGPTGGEAYLRVPGWVLALGAVAIVAAGWYRRRETLVFMLAAVVVGILFVQWPEHAVWNARWLPFWLLSWGFLAAMGATEIVRLLGLGARATFGWIRAGDLHDSRAIEWIRLARDEHGDVDNALRTEAVEVVATRQFERVPPGWEPPPGVQERWVVSRVDLLSRAALAAMVVAAGVFAVNRAWDARDDNTAVQIQGWARWNYSGYEEKPAWPEFKLIMDTMGELDPGRALWEPSARQDDPINTYGTSLALELLPYFTDGRIGSMEGLYFESSGTTSYHFLTVAKVAQYPSNPVRGLVYGNLADDFDDGVENMRQLGVRYYMAWTDEAQAKADASDELELVADIPDVDGLEPTGWKVYELRDYALVEGLRYEPVVAKTRAGSYSECWDVEWPDPNTPQPELGDWECDAARWWADGGELLQTPWAASGPDAWERIDFDDLADAPRTPLDPVRVTDVVEKPDKISFSVDEVGVPVVVRASYFPNWKAHGAEGPYRLAPNMMVVIPTQRDVSLTYDLTGVDWLGRILTLLGLVGLVVLVRWKSLTRHGADTSGEADAEPVAGPDPGSGDGDERVPPDWAREPALP